MTKYLSSPRGRRYTLQGLLAATALGLGTAAVLTSVDRSAPVMAQEAEPNEVEGLDQTVYGNVMLLRHRVGLVDKDLAALGLTQAEAEAVLDRLVTWCETNQEALALAEKRVYAAERELSVQQRLVRTGKASSRQLKDEDGKAAAVKTASDAYEQLLKTGGAFALQAQGVDAGKTTAWTRALALKGESINDLRYLPGMDAARLTQIRADAKAQRRSLEQSLNLSERRELKSIRAQIQTLMPGIRLAEDKALPLPDELRTPEEALLNAQGNGD